MKRINTILATGMLLIATGCIPGHRPETEIKYGYSGFRFADTKDNNVSWDALEINRETKTVKVTGFSLRNNASDPIAAFAEQMRVQVALHEQLGKNMNQLLGQINKMLATVAPLATLAIAQNGAGPSEGEEAGPVPP